MREWRDEVRERLAGLGLSPSRETEIVEELSQHLEQRRDELVAQGSSEDEAQRIALHELSGPITLAQHMEPLQQSCLAAPMAAGLPSGALSGLRDDLRLAIRVLRGTPVVSTAAILSLALGIGANTAIFSIADSLLLRPLPVDRPQQLAVVLSQPPGAAVALSTWSNPVWEQIRERRHQLFETAFAYSARISRFNLAPAGEADLVDGIWVSGDYFSGLGVPPLLGRTLTSSDDQRGGGPAGAVAVISYGMWQRRYGGRTDVFGRTVTIDRAPFTIVGVMPAGFFGADVGTSFDIAVPLGTESLIRGRDSYLDRPTTSWLAIMARLKDGQQPGQAQSALQALSPHIREVTMPQGFPPESQARYLSAPLTVESAAIGTSSMRTRYRRPLLILLAVVALVLLIACANIANLQTARAVSRRHEFSVRLALGASRWRLVRQLIVESLVLATIGAVLGLLLAQWMSAFLIRQLSTYANTVFISVPIDGRVIGFTAALAAAAAIVFGTLPSWLSFRSEPAGALRAHGRSAIDRQRGSGAVLVAGQVALSFILLITAGLLIRTFASIAGRDLGFDREAVLVTQLDLRTTSVAPSARNSFYGSIADEIAALPGVARAAVSDITPVSGSLVDTYIEVENGPPVTEVKNVAFQNVMTSGWFATYGTRVISGRDFDARDQATTTPVVVVNETFVRRFLPSGSPLGRRIRKGAPERSGPMARDSRRRGGCRISIHARIASPHPLSPARAGEGAARHHAAERAERGRTAGAPRQHRGVRDRSARAEHRDDVHSARAASRRGARAGAHAGNPVGILRCAGSSARRVGFVWDVLVCGQSSTPRAWHPSGVGGHASESAAARAVTRGGACGRRRRRGRGWLSVDLEVPGCASVRRGTVRANHHHVRSGHSGCSRTAGGVDPRGPSVTNRTGGRASRFVENGCRAPQLLCAPGARRSAIWLVGAVPVFCT